MVCKETKIIIADNSGAIKARCIHVYKSQSNQIGNVVKSVLCQFDAKKKLVKKKKYLNLIVTTKQKRRRRSGTFVYFSENRGLLMADEEKFIGSRVHGPVAKELKKKLSEQQFKKFRTMAPLIV